MTRIDPFKEPYRSIPLRNRIDPFKEPFNEPPKAQKVEPVLFAIVRDYFADPRERFGIVSVLQVG